MSALHDALNSSLPTPPPAPPIQPPPVAHHNDEQQHSVPPHFLARSPTYLRTLTRSTLPTSSISHLPSSAYRTDQPPSSSSGSGLPDNILTVDHSPPTRSSLDSLRSLRQRDRDRDLNTHVHEPPIRRRQSKSKSPSSRSQSQSVDIREFTTTAANSAWKWWAGDQKEQKEQNDRLLLNEQDQAPTAEEEQAKMQRKCAFLQVLCSPSLRA